jgi:hypothetical protein
MTLRILRTASSTSRAFYLLGLLPALVLFALAPQSLAEQWARKMFRETHHDFGTVSRNAKTEYAFAIENVFEEDVRIVAVRSSCGCTNPVLTKKTIKPGEKGEVIAQFNTRAFIGTKTAEITVVIDRPNYAEVKLTVGGKIRSDIVVEPGEVKFGDVDMGSTKTVDLKISYAGRKDWKIMDIRGDSEFLEVKLAPAKRNGTLTDYTLHIRLKENAAVGEILDELIVVTNDEKNDQFTLPVSARIIPPLSVSPTYVSVGDIGKGKTAQQKFIVRAKAPFAITSIECADDRIEFAKPEGTKTVHIIPFTVRGELAGVDDTGVLKQTIKVRTTLGEDIQAETTVAGRIIH